MISSFGIGLGAVFGTMDKYDTYCKLMDERTDINEKVTQNKKIVPKPEQSGE